MFCCECYQIFRHSGECRQGVVVIITSKLHSTKSELNFCADSNLACSVSDICYGENGSARNKWRKRLSSVNHFAGTIYNYHSFLQETFWRMLSFFYSFAIIWPYHLKTITFDIITKSKISFLLLLLLLLLLYKNVFHERIKIDSIFTITFHFTFCEFTCSLFRTSGSSRLAEHIQVAF